MTHELVSQTEINQVCQTLQKGGEEITIDRVKKILGKGLHSELSVLINLFKTNKQAAIKVAKAEAKNSTEKECSINQVAEDSATNLSQRINNLIKDNPNAEKITLQLRDIVQKHIDQEVSNKVALAKKDKLKAEQKHDRIETQFLHLRSLYYKLYELNERLEDHIKLSKNISNEAIKKLHSEQANPIKKAMVKSTHIEQLEQLSGPRKAAYNQESKIIALKVTDFHAPLHKVIQLGKKGVLQAKAIHNYQTKLWELTSYTPTTIKFLVQNGFDISEELHDLFKKMKKQQ
jgi:hypothetical protein